MALPEALRKAEETANEAHKAVYPDQYKTDEEKAKDAQEHREPGKENTDAALQAGNPGSDEAKPKEGEGQPAAQEGIKTDGEDWRQRFLVLQGKYNAEVPTLHAKVKDLDAELATLRSGQAVQKPDDKKNPDALESKLAKYREEFGDDVVNMALDIAESKASEKATVVTQEVDKKLGEDAWGRFTARLSGMVPEWEAVNSSADWKRWLGQIDTATGKTRQALLDEASGALDAVRVAGIFKQFAGASTAEQNKKAELESMIQPGKGKGGAPMPTDNKNEKVFTRNEISKFYDDMRRGVYKGREADANKLEVEINNAVMSGRVR